MTKQEALRKLDSGGYEKALAFCHPQQRMDVILELSIWMQKVNKENIDDKEVLNMIRFFNKSKQLKNIKKQQNKGLIDDELNPKVFYHNNNFFDQIKKDSQMSSDDIQQLLNKCLYDFYKDTLEQHQQVLFLHIIRQWSHRDIAEFVGLKKDGVKHLILNWRKNGFYSYLKKEIKEVLGDKI